VLLPALGERSASDCTCHLAAARGASLRERWSMWRQQADGNRVGRAAQVKALRERNSVVKRKASIIINNMSKLVLNPADAAPFLPRLLPEVRKVGRPAASAARAPACSLDLLMWRNKNSAAMAPMRAQSRGHAGGCAWGRRLCRGGFGSRPCAHGGAAAPLEGSWVCTRCAGQQL